MSTKLKRPTKARNSRRFDPDQNSADDFSPKPKSTRPTSYTEPLPLGDPSLLTQESAPLTAKNLQSHLNDLKRQESSSKPAKASQSSSHLRTGSVPSTFLFPHMPKNKSPKKLDKKKAKLDEDSHPLNLPPDELKRLSAAMAREEARIATPMDLDTDEQTFTNGASTSQPPSPSKDIPGAFADPDTNHSANDEESEGAKSPTPPPHKTPPPPKVDPEACKAAGNKFFKAKDYDRAIQEYTKGM
jgi:DnaJ homolog subfamily C member 7